QRNGPDAVEQYLPAMPGAASKDYRDHLWTARLLFSSGRASPAAEKALRRAVELADTEPETWVALVGYLSATGRRADAEAEVERARVKLTGRQGALALAQCYEAAGNVAKAREMFKAVLEARPQDVQARRNYVGLCLRTGAAREAEA